MIKNKIVLVFGTFDILHKGHLNFFEQAKKYGDILVVVVSRDETVKKIKGKFSQNNEKERLISVKNTKIAEKVLLGNKGDKYKVIREIKPDKICLGYDQNAFTDNLKSEIVKLNLKTKIYRMKPYQEDVYKSSKMNKHKTVGIIIKNEKEEILMIDRKNFPFGWACPAGHIEEDEEPEQAVIREAKEEVGLIIKNYKQILNEYVDWNECNRGVKGHDWYLFEADKYIGEIKLERKEVKKFQWVKTENLKNLKLEEVWEYWFKKLEIL